MRTTKRITSMVLVLTCILCIMPVMQAKASAVTIQGGHDAISTAYNWGSYSKYNSITAKLPAEEKDFWVKFILPRNNKIYARCSYNNQYVGMAIEILNSNNITIDRDNSLDEVYNDGSVVPFIAAKCDNLTSSTQTFYIHVSRGESFKGNMYFTISMNDRLRTGHGEFSFSGTAINNGNRPVSLSGRDSSILTLNLSNDSRIPQNAIVTLVRTDGSQSPNQGNVHHMICPATDSGVWYTSTYSSATSGRYNISVSDEYHARQRWQFKYNAQATAKSTMSRVKLTLEWEYDIAMTGYKAV